MLNSIKKIYFIGRRQGIFPFSNSKWFLENSRNGELAGIRKNPELQIVNSIKKSDIIFIRNKPESTTDKQIQKMELIIKDVRTDRLVINDVQNFFKIDNKDITFDIWKKNNVKCPDYCMLNPLNINKSLEKIKKMLSSKESVLLRINNRTGGTAMVKVDRNYSEENIINKLKRLNSNVINYRNIRAKTNILAVEHINNGNGDYTHAFRAHIIEDEIISFYVAISKTLVVSMSKLTFDDLEEFIRINSKYIELMQDTVFRKNILKAMQSITNMGAVDFLLVNGEPIFLEINPIWKGNFFENNFGNNKILLDWFYNKPDLEKVIPNVFQFKSPIQYWKNFYTILQNKC